MPLRLLVLVCLCGAMLAPAMATPLPPAARAEVLQLLTRLEQSGCQFDRNGSWYSGAEAGAHLRRKLAYFEDKAALQRAEDFIEQGASTSSSSGRAYQVRCGTTPAQPSRNWLLEQLRLLRTTPASASTR